MRLARDHNFSFYDALIVAAALEAGCDTLFTEDMQDGRVIQGLTIRNPFWRRVGGSRRIWIRHEVTRVFPMTNETLEFSALE